MKYRKKIIDLIKNYQGLHESQRIALLHQIKDIKVDIDQGNHPDVYQDRDAILDAVIESVDNFANEDPCYVQIEPDLPSLTMIDVEDVIKIVQALKEGE